ncbi:MAG: glutamine--fructose-6-phosphate transaminase (isomerizing) [Alphaproteobacteria bacterium]
MCGIVGIISANPVASRLLEGLQRLEYRGYDSAGIATITDGRLERRRAKGKLINLKKLIAEEPISGNIGIGHTRWATHGIANEINAHPHINERVAIVHNGIIENYQGIKQRLIDKGHEFLSQTDTEVIAHLIADHMSTGLEPLPSVEATLKELKGAFALAIIFVDFPDLMIVARRGSPLAIGYGQGEISIGSDALALALWTKDICYLEEGDYAVVTLTDVKIYSSKGAPVIRPIKKIALTAESLAKGPYRHYMLKEIFEQPTAIADTLQSFIDPLLTTDLDIPWESLERCTSIACGASFYAAMVAKYWFEKLARIPVDVDIASEFRYRDPVWSDNGLCIFISQSGETIDTLAALQLAKANEQLTLAIVNVPESSIARLAQHAIHTLAGPEISVTSTKGFTTQLLTMGCLALTAAHQRGFLDDTELAANISELTSLPTWMQYVLDHDQTIKKLARKIEKAQNVMYLGRGPMYPLALEGALKLKEVSYIHAQGYPAGELKHGPIALVDPQVPVIVLCPTNEWCTKTASNIQEILARGGNLLVLTDEPGAPLFASVVESGGEIMILPKSPSPLVTSILYSIPLQLLAYHVAVIKGTDVDQPRNLAKSVTVE